MFFDGLFEGYVCVLCKCKWYDSFFKILEDFCYDLRSEIHA